jgi:hypothetical protein
MRKFYIVYRERDPEIVQSGIGQLSLMQDNGIVQSEIGQLILDRGAFPFKLSWTHYQVLMTIENDDERAFYEMEAIKGIHSKYAVIDKEVLWYGSMNLVSNIKEEDDEMRIVNVSVAKALIDDQTIDIPD